MRKLHLLIAEWRASERLKDERTHKLMCAFGWKLPDGASLGDIFPLLATEESAQSSVDDLSDDDVIFREPTEALGL